MPKVERHVLLMVIDKLWVDHLTAMDDLRQGVGLQAYGQKDPLVVYKTEGYRMFAQLQTEHPARCGRGPSTASSRSGAAAGADATDRDRTSHQRAEDTSQSGTAESHQGPAQPALPMRQRQEVQVLPWRTGRHG